MIELPSSFFWWASITGVKMPVRSSGAVKASMVCISGNDWNPYSVTKRAMVRFVGRERHASVPHIPDRATSPGLVRSAEVSS